MEKLFSSSKPIGLEKLVLYSPSESAFLFIFLTNSSTDPALCSARATAASFPEWMIAAYRRSFTRICSFSYNQTLEPVVSAAFFETVTTSSRSFSSRIIVVVISLVMLAIEARS